MNSHTTRLVVAFAVTGCLLVGFQGEAPSQPERRTLKMKQLIRPSISRVDKSKLLKKNLLLKKYHLLPKHIQKPPLSPCHIIPIGLDEAPPVFDFPLIVADEPPAELPQSWNRDALSGYIVFKDRQVSGGSGKTIGNGLMITRSAVLTARHVAESVKANPEQIDILVINSQSPSFFTRLKYQGVQHLADQPDGRQTDIALVMVERSHTPVWYPTFDSESVNLREGVYMLGAQEFSLLPRIGTGIVTTEKKVRLLGGQIPETTLGSNLVSFAGQSGSPVFRSSTGELLGIITGGYKEWAKAGESVVRAPKDQSLWEEFPHWTWIVPLGAHADELAELAAQ